MSAGDGAGLAVGAGDGAGQGASGDSGAGASAALCAGDTKTRWRAGERGRACGGAGRDVRAGEGAGEHVGSGAGVSAEGASCSGAGAGSPSDVAWFAGAVIGASVARLLAGSFLHPIFQAGQRGALGVAAYVPAAMAQRPSRSTVAPGRRRDLGDEPCAGESSRSLRGSANDTGVEPGVERGSSG